MVNVDTISFIELKQALAQAGVRLHPAEVHGLQLGIICGDSSKPSPLLLMEVLATEYPNLDAIQDAASSINLSLMKLLTKIHNITIEKFQGINFSFEILLPDDDENFAPRLKALRAFARGLLSGLGLVLTKKRMQKDKLIMEILRDVENIANVEVVDLDNGANIAENEEGEACYMELVEYLKVAIQTLHAEMQR